MGLRAYRGGLVGGTKNGALWLPKARGFAFRAKERKPYSLCPFLD
jgi:hypothetical protein